MTKTVYHYLKANDALDDIRQSRLKVSLIGKLNDSRELQAVVFKDVSQAENDRLVADFTRNMGIICFSEERDNPMCWERYADENQGICLAFGIAAERIVRVDYVTKLEQIIFPELWLQKWRSEGRLTDEIAQALHPYVIRKYATKFEDHNRWNQEKEWRTFPKLDHDSVTRNGFYFSDDWRGNYLRLKRVILGACCSASVREVQDALVSHYRSHPNSGEVKIERVPLPRGTLVP